MRLDESICNFSMERSTKQGSWHARVSFFNIRARLCEPCIWFPLPRMYYIVSSFLLYKHSCIEQNCLTTNARNVEWGGDLACATASNGKNSKRSWLVEEQGLTSDANSLLPLMTSNRRIKLFCIAFLLLNGQDASFRSYFITDILSILSFEIKGGNKTIKAKDALLQEFKKTRLEKRNAICFRQSKAGWEKWNIDCELGLDNRSFVAIRWSHRSTQRNAKSGPNGSKQCDAMN